MTTAFCKSATHDGFRNAVEVCAVGGLDGTAEERLQWHFDCSVAEQKDGFNFSAKGL